mmetsp:Transcript_99867/g.137404  ORF Transcript_99867/g.137404 Transcript_99867/m.137404 type:complete len:294 (-) Transcript_99867:673-1554(-)
MRARTRAPELLALAPASPYCQHRRITCATSRERAGLAVDQAPPERPERLLRGDVVVGHAVLLADLLHNLAALAVAMVPDAGEEVVLNLRRQAEGQVEPEVGVCGEVDALGDLHLRPRVVLVVVREHNDVRHLRHGEEDHAGCPEHGQVAPPGGPQEVVHDQPGDDLGDGVAEGAVHDEVAADAPLDEQVHEEELRADLDHGTNGQEGQGQDLHPTREHVRDPDVLHIHVVFLVRVGVVADGMPVHPGHGRAGEEVAQELGEAVDPLVPAHLEVGALMRHPGANRGHQDPSRSA